MKTKFLVAIALVLGLSISSADAQIKHRAQNQHHRIRQGVKSGELTKREAQDLREDHKDLHQDVKLAKSDGKVTAGERKIIKKEERKDSREIYRKKHNSRDRN
jgi:uncharacterized protein YoaH (UPF0181 family)